MNVILITCTLKKQSGLRRKNKKVLRASVVGSGDTKVEQSSGNVFKGVGFSDTEAERALLKADLALEIYNIIESQKLTQAQAGKILGIDPSDISRLKAGDFNRFSVERLFTLLNRFNRNIEIRITPAEDREGHQRVVAV